LDGKTTDGVKDTDKLTPEAPFATLLKATVVSYAETMAGYLPSTLDASSLPAASVNADAMLTFSA
jgi:hypothetical protein